MWKSYKQIALGYLITVSDPFVTYILLLINTRKQTKQSYEKNKNIRREQNKYILQHDSVSTY